MFCFHLWYVPYMGIIVFKLFFATSNIWNQIHHKIRAPAISNGISTYRNLSDHLISKNRSTHNTAFSTQSRNKYPIMNKKRKSIRKKICIIKTVLDIYFKDILPFCFLSINAVLSLISVNPCRNIIPPEKCSSAVAVSASMVVTPFRCTSPET